MLKTLMRGRDGKWDVFNMNLNLADIKSGKHLEENKIRTARAIEDIIEELGQKYDLRLHKEISSPKYFIGTGMLVGSSDYIELVYSFGGNEIRAISSLPKECIDYWVLPAYAQESWTIDGFASYDAVVFELKVMGNRESGVYGEVMERFDKLAVTPKKWTGMRKEKARESHEKLFRGETG